jgi:hypothetical protein
MKTGVKLTLALLLALALLPSMAVADTSPWVVTLTGVNGWNYGGVYTSPYYLTAQNGTDTLTGIAFACDDFTTDININDSWPATLSTLSNVPRNATTVGSQKFPNDSGTPIAGDITVTLPDGGGTPSYMPYIAYEAAGYLAQQVLNDVQQGNQNLAYEDSYAIWQIFDPTAAITGYNNGVAGATINGASFVSLVQTQMQTAFSTVTAANYAGLGETLDIFTPCGPQGSSVCSTPPNSSSSQEFLGFGLNPDVVPSSEGSSVAFLLFDFLVAIGAFFIFRNRFMRRSAAKS